MTAGLLLLRALQVGLKIDDLTMITMGELLDLCTEQANDSAKYDYLATQEDIDTLLG